MSVLVVILLCMLSFIAGITFMYFVAEWIFFK